MNSYADILNSFKDKHVLIIGDVMIDAYIWGENTRNSPEAPVPVVDVSKREAKLGGAANVALNIASCGARATILSVIGNDQRAEEFKELMSRAGLSAEAVHSSKSRRTTVKTRVISNAKHMLRVDEEDKFDLNKEEIQELFAHFDRILSENEVDAIILQDYNKGVLTPGVIQRTIAVAKEKGIPTMVDPKKENFTRFAGCSLFKPNLKEMREGIEQKVNPEDLESLNSAVEALQASMRHDATLITLSEHGVYWNTSGESGIHPVFERNIVDVSGAGDTVISVASLALCSGASLSQAALMSNLAGGLVCEEVGVSSISREALAAGLMSFKE